MNFLRQFVLWLSRWIDDAALAILAIVNAFRPTRKFQAIEQDGVAFVVKASRRRSARPIVGATLRFVEGKFVGDESAKIRSQLAGGQIELVLARRRFVFRYLELPTQAAGFLDAIIRSQIDRLTPWSPAQAAFGFDPPKQTSTGRIGVVVAATARSALTPFVVALGAFKPSSIVVSAAAEAGTDERRTIVFSQEADRELSMRRLRRVLAAAPVLAGLAALAAFAARLQVGADLEDTQLQVSRHMAERRAALSSGRADVLENATAKLAQMKRESPPSVIVLESLSQALPDDTYLTELHIVDGKLEITGVTREAASLIRIIEQTEQFKNATFFAPTTRAPMETGEQFHIEAQLVATDPAVP
ncbi:general secretion pathway protein L [Roseiarcus fermentans]|uniref:General secretion pathway protein L n=1 Tax=Roseiarcus fermentans TaxID=1473586 RepID=A0A366EQH0_9HYPH|nr:PilN domain-containing protein [Roseiarcus fermentans]RBP04663.1 general secretion pathway protein L [Roseiarcus fermentans]